MRIISRRFMRFGAVAAFGAALVATPTSASAATIVSPVSVTCGGLTTDVAGSVSGAPKSSKEILDLAGGIAGLKSLPPFPTTVTTDAPEKLKIKSGDTEVTLTYNMGVPAEIGALLRDKLSLQSLIVQKFTAGVNVTGPVTASVSDVAPDTTLDLNNPASTVAVTMKVKVSTDASGRIFFRPTPITFELNFGNLSVAGIATIGTATLQCDAQGIIASTSVQVPGTPNTPAQVVATATGGETLRIPLKDRSDFLPEEGNPIEWDSLRITKAANGATIENGVLVQPTAAEGGTYENDVELCGAARLTADSPGTDEIQALTFPSTYTGAGFNAHPLGMKLSFKGQTTAEIPLTTLYGTGLEGLFGQFQAPTAQAIEDALVRLSNIDAGDVTVTRESDGSYRVLFSGKLGEANQPKIELAVWRTWLDYSAYEGIQKAISDLAGGGGGGDPTDPGTGDPTDPGPADPAATDLTLEQLAAELNAGRITIDVYFAKFGSALKNSLIKSLPISDILAGLKQIFPQPPEITEPRQGEARIPGASTGPLCTNFSVKTVANAAPQIDKASDRVVRPCRVSGRTVKTRVAVKTTVGKRKRTIYRTVKVIRTVRSGGCPQAIVLKGGKITLSDLPVRRAKVTTQPKKVTVTVTAKGIGGKASGTFTVSSTTSAASGSLTLPAALAGAGRLTVTIGGPGVAKVVRTVMPS